MNAHTLSPDAKRLREIRAALDSIAPADWTRVHDQSGAFIEMRGAMGELFVLARFDAGATNEEMAFATDAPDMVRFLLRLLDNSFQTIRKLKGTPPANQAAGEPAANKNFAAECALKCQDARFKVYLEERHGLERPLTDDRVAQRVRSILGVRSRIELNTDGSAAEAWKALRADFAAWLKAQR
ncbi:hypothetical protein [Mesorhizobium sp. M2A.F.Ca.ET.039.01.1.1]|uniref:hypothetical protein n=1 Tax=Mesorhizobium sp. M2A.F.Ca.ET.039.01.1.1 TaxID=2496746 RepID=UPI000FCAEACD|nr:hypothetical protein [Mesorhizobium sp. M2A.F.Ca.ET.039.01.1.1]RWX60070.1 hypothetical protein EOA24_34105 [Mesorhizobium sp. M2A.F.Ca.ET.039.01.1.1]TIV48100.1 MAG: hypothetical protein E5V96_00380 [Mesorhizobium sp.]